MNLHYVTLISDYIPSFEFLSEIKSTEVNRKVGNEKNMDRTYVNKSFIL